MVLESGEWRHKQGRANIIRYWKPVMLKFNVREGDRKNNGFGQKQLGPHNTVIHTTPPTHLILTRS